MCNRIFEQHFVLPLLHILAVYNFLASHRYNFQNQLSRLCCQSVLPHRAQEILQAMHSYRSSFQYTPYNRHLQYTQLFHSSCRCSGPPNKIVRNLSIDNPARVRVPVPALLAHPWPHIHPRPHELYMQNTLCLNCHNHPRHNKFHPCGSWA